ncbi:hypothetical protein [Pararhizobium sp. O133]|uniref:hypothetical protein n=1 Tax=Pararhizobium sp. O133 TaxID=3449278 RepID=UPI003F684C18
MLDLRERAGPLMKRVAIDGHEIFLPVDATLHDGPPADASDEELLEWLEKDLLKPLGGTW